MKKVSRGLDALLSSADRERAVQEIIRFFQSERDEEIGTVAAEEVLDLFMQALAPAVYNKGVADAQALLSSSAEQLAYELDSLKRSE